MVLYVINPNLEILDIIENTKSVIWNNKYYECGEFEVVLPATQKYISLLRRGNYLVRAGHEDNAMIIQGVKLDTDIEEGNKIYISGECIKSLIKRRIVWQQTNVSGNIETCIKKLLDENVINPVDTSRKLDYFTFRAIGLFKDTISAQYTGDNIYDVIVTICQDRGIGWNVSLDLDNKQFVFYLYKGVDRSYNQSVNPFVVFSADFENVLNTTYISDDSNYMNVARVAGEGEGTARKYVTVGEASGLERYELFVDARNTSSNDGKVSDSDYKTLLEEAGKEKLSEHQLVESYEGEIESGQNYTLGVDYNLGDIVEVVNEYGMEASTRIIEIIENEDETGNRIVPTFSSWY